MSATIKYLDLNANALVTVWAVDSVESCELSVKKECGIDSLGFGENLDHRKVWIGLYLRQFAFTFGVNLLGFAIHLRIRVIGKVW